MQSAANHIAGVTLELGGKSPIVVLADADLERVVNDVKKELCANAGQICSAGTRLVIDRSVHSELKDRLITEVQSIQIGPAVDESANGTLNFDDAQG